MYKFIKGKGLNFEDLEFSHFEKIEENSAYLNEEDISDSTKAIMSKIYDEAILEINKTKFENDDPKLIHLQKNLQSKYFNLLEKLKIGVYSNLRPFLIDDREINSTHYSIEKTKISRPLIYLDQNIYGILRKELLDKNSEKRLFKNIFLLKSLGCLFVYSDSIIYEVNNFEAGKSNEIKANNETIRLFLILISDICDDLYIDPDKGILYQRSPIELFNTINEISDLSLENIDIFSLSLNPESFKQFRDYFNFDVKGIGSCKSREEAIKRIDQCLSEWKKNKSDGLNELGGNDSFSVEIPENFQSWVEKMEEINSINQSHISREHSQMISENILLRLCGFKSEKMKNLKDLKVGAPFDDSHAFIATMVSCFITDDKRLREIIRDNESFKTKTGSIVFSARELVEFVDNRLNESKKSTVKEVFQNLVSRFS